MPKITLVGQKKEKQDSEKNYTKIKLMIFFVPIVIIVIIFSIKTFLGPFYPPYLAFISEDQPVEYTTFIVYIITFIISILVANSLRKLKKRWAAISFFIIAFVFIFIAIEEISWGQRILGFETWGIFSESTQGEVNIHDLRFFEYFEDPSFIVVGFLGGLLWIIFLKSSNNNYYTFKTFFVPRWYLMTYFIPVAIFYLILNLAPPEVTSFEGLVKWNFLYPRDQEPFELILALGFLGFVLGNYIKLRHIFRKEDSTKTEQ